MLNKNIFTAAALILLGTSIQVKAQDITVAGTVRMFTATRCLA